MTIAEYDRLIASGHFDTPTGIERTELIEGELRPMSPIGPIHDWLVERLNRWSCRTTSEDLVAIRIQGCVAFHESGSVPEPDVIWIRQGDFRNQRPASQDVLLIIEVADFSLACDCGEKANLYASGGVADYWVVNIPDKCVEVFRQPEQGKYREHQVFKAGDEIRPLAFPAVNCPVALLFPAK
ncbi:MAG: Uma2 family endonuclease [Planctomycetes bacterium]|nr:Uma2 family endonuclease [Planctomycetota bacterium]